jgi:hypothetical protein
MSRQEAGVPLKQGNPGFFYFLKQAGGADQDEAATAKAVGEPSKDGKENVGWSLFL